MHYKSPQPKKLFDEEFRLEKLAGQKDPLVKLKERIDFELFRSLLEEIFHAKESNHSAGMPNGAKVERKKHEIFNKYPL